MGFLTDSCTLKVLTQELLADCKPFHCGDPGLDKFFSQESVLHHKAMLGKTYCFVLDDKPSDIICAFTLSNDSVRVDHLPNARKKKVNARISRVKQMNRYPAILIGKLGVNLNYANLGVGSDLLSTLKRFASHHDNLSDCRMLAVDAKANDRALHYYEKNQFRYLYSSEEQEAENRHMPLPLKTRFMFFDLIDLQTE